MTKANVLKKYVLNNMLLSYKYNSVDNRKNNKGNANKYLKGI